MDLTCFYTILDTSSPLDIAFEAPSLDNLSLRKFMAQTCRSFWAHFHKASGLACNPRAFTHYTCFRGFIRLIISPTHINRGEAPCIGSSSLATISAILNSCGDMTMLYFVIWSYLFGLRDVNLER